MDALPTRNPDLEWLDHVKPTGLVLSPAVIDELGLVPERQTAADTAHAAAYIDPDPDHPALPDPWAFVHHVLGWELPHVAGAPGGPPLPDGLAVSIPEHDTVLAPGWAIQGFDADAPYQLLVELLPAGLDPDARGAAEGWEATAHQRFERLLRETGVLAGVLLTDTELRLVYAPRGETSGWLAFPLRSLATVAGRSMLAGLKLLLGGFRLFNEPTDRRLQALLKASRAAQAAVSTQLADQVLGALHELLRGFTAAEPELIHDLAKERPQHLYEGLLAVLLRLVFVLYAEDRDLVPSRQDAKARTLYQQSYSVRGLYGRLVEQAALNPDTMDERQGAWGQLLALFRLVHGGHASGFVRARRGKLFDPDAFPFLEGRSEPGEPPRVVRLADGSVHRILEGLMTVPNRVTKVRERLSYRTLDVEQIGSVYETVMGFRVELARGRVLAIKAGKHNKTPVFADLTELARLKAADRPKYLKDACKRDGTLGRGVTQALAAAVSEDELAAALDAIADERGSPQRRAAAPGTVILQPTEERRRTGSHYTPRDLTQPIVLHALRPAFDRLGDAATPDQVLALKVCDPAMGSGAFLVEACRQLAERLTKAWARHPGSRPPIPADEDEDLLARRLVAQRCLYGVDANPMAVDLARLSLWLATLARDHEFTFLDHALKAGDSLVGLDLRQIEAAHWDADAGGAQYSLLHGMVRAQLDKGEAERRRIREAVEDASEADLRPVFDRAQAALAGPKLIGDAVVAAFFAGAKPRERERARAEVEQALGQFGRAWEPELRDLSANLPLRPFHWPLEFPEVFDRREGGFDAIVGNPPYGGHVTVSSGHVAGYTDWLRHLHQDSAGKCDVVAHFFRRAFQITRNAGALGLLATKSIRQGDTRQSGLTAIRDRGGVIFRAVRRLKWPGDAAVVVAVVHVARGPLPGPYELDGRPVDRITAFLFHTGADDDPAPLAANANKSFVGSYVLGMGFTFDDRNVAKGSTPLAEMHRLIEKDPRNAERIFPYIGGEEVNDSPTHAHHRYVIDFGDLPEDDACSGWPELFIVVQNKVKPERLRSARSSKSGHGGRALIWWQHYHQAKELRRKIKHKKRCIVIARVSQSCAFTFLSTQTVFSEQLIVFDLETYAAFAVIQSRPHEVWARFFASSMKDDLRYTPSDCFETFPFPPGFADDAALEAAGEAYYAFRAELMVRRQKGLTKTYNDVHDPARKDADIQELRRLHHAMDVAVLRAYGWHDLAEAAAPVFLDATNEDEFAYQGRLFWPSPFRDEVLARLLALNTERHAEEVRLGIAPGRGHGHRQARDADDEYVA